MSCNCNKYARDYARIVELAQKQANIENIEYVVYQNENNSYGYCKREFVPEGCSTPFVAIPIN